ncbi:hypothetical protein SAMN04487983_1001114 [Streptomyces sp. yr375]|nr:hypothetical protein SAMN04487983_1001114 [Streptomyces sp. yr375]
MFRPQDTRGATQVERHKKGDLPQVRFGRSGGWVDGGPGLRAPLRRSRRPVERHVHRAPLSPYLAHRVRRTHQGRTPRPRRGSIAPHPGRVPATKTRSPNPVTHTTKPPAHYGIRRRAARRGGACGRSRRGATAARRSRWGRTRRDGRRPVTQRTTPPREGTTSRDRPTPPGDGQQGRFRSAGRPGRSPAGRPGQSRRPRVTGSDGEPLGGVGRADGLDAARRRSRYRRARRNGRGPVTQRTAPPCDGTTDRDRPAPPGTVTHTAKPPAHHGIRRRAARRDRACGRSRRSAAAEPVQPGAVRRPQAGDAADASSVRRDDGPRPPLHHRATDSEAGSGQRDDQAGPRRGNRVGP